MSIFFSILITLAIAVIVGSAIYLIITFFILKKQEKKEKEPLTESKK